MLGIHLSTEYVPRARYRERAHLGSVANSSDGIRREAEKQKGSQLSYILTYVLRIRLTKCSGIYPVHKR